MESYIELNRSFYELPANFGQAAKTDDIDLKDRLDFHIGETQKWDDLLKAHRVILLAEAGAGKTQEIRNITKRLNLDGKTAFFLRLEHITTDFEAAFEEGTSQAFQSWLGSNDEGWIFLDSVDEARLKDTKDFEGAIRKLSSKITPAIQRVHIFITSRITAWRPKTDLATCNAKFPFLPLNEQELIGESEILDDSDHTNQSLAKKCVDTTSHIKSSGFKIYSLTDLSREQIFTFAKAKGVRSDSIFLDEINRQDAWAFTTRPQDLEEIIEFWHTQKRIGTRLELMKNSVERRIKERDEDRAESRPLALEKAHDGVCLLAAACTLLRKSTIRVPDGANNSEGVDAKAILTNWDDKECQILLSRPIFDDAIYGSVRFHHRSVREYLTAEWLSKLLSKQGSRQKIENLLFRKQYGMQVIIPSMKPVLSWLVLFDAKIMQKVFEIEPEIILQGGDPSKLPLETRENILRAICLKISIGTSSRDIGDHATVQRFASPELANEVKKLMQNYGGDKSVVSYLLHMIWQGRIKDALPDAKLFALNPKTEPYVRTTAIRATKEVGLNEDFNDILKSFQSETGPHNRSVLAEIVGLVDSSKEHVIWILDALENVQDKERHTYDGLSQTLAYFVDRSSSEVVYELVKGIDKLLRREPFIERRHCEISEKFGWLMPIVLKCIENLILNRHPYALNEESLFVLTLFQAFQDYRDFDSLFLKQNVSVLVQEWSELNHRLFWAAVEGTRRTLHQKNEQLTNFWQTSIYGKYWNFDNNHFQLIIDDIDLRPLFDDKLVALSLAFHLYRENNRPKKWLSELKRAVSTNQDLENSLLEFLSPPTLSTNIQKLKQKQDLWNRRNKERQKKAEKDGLEFVEWLSKNYQKLRDNGLGGGIVSDPQYYMHEKMRSIDRNTSKWTTGNWKALIKDYGVDAATAFRDGVVSFWRQYSPLLRSEKIETNSTSFAVVFGLSGLKIESETPGWPETLSEKDAELACRYALEELNDFPGWFYSLYKEFPQVVVRIILHEINWELRAENQDKVMGYVLSKVSWDCEWMWNDLAPTLMKKLEFDYISGVNIECGLKILQGCQVVSESQICELAERKCKAINSLNIASWYSVWIDGDPENAINNFAAYLSDANNNDPDKAKNLAMQVLVKLVGGRRTATSAKEHYKTAKHLKELYLLMHQYIKVTEDINRLGQGVYSPTLRDDAQDARSSLFSMLKNIPGKESYLAMVELSKTHPVISRRIWMMIDAKERAENDADISPWSLEKFNEFNKALESTPSNHRELFDLGSQRLFDLKYDLEEGDESISTILLQIKNEKEIRKFIAGWCRDRAFGKYVIPQEEELADAKKPDLRFWSSLFDAPVPVELKLADNWTGPGLFERLENQLCGDYLRDARSSLGIFVLVYRGEKETWELPYGSSKAQFAELIDALQLRWDEISDNYSKIDQIKVVGIDLTRRTQI